LFEHVWTCSHCGKELGRSSSGIDRPPYDSCPYCGAKFMNNIGGKFQRPGSSFRPSDGGPPPSHQQPPGGFAPPSNSGGPGAPPNSGQPPGGPSGGFGPGRDGSPDADVNEEEPAFPEDSDLPSTGTQGSFSSLRLWLLVGGLVVLMLAGGAGGVVLILIGMKRRKPARASKRRRQRRGYEYEEVSY
jgi:DNA-directed RNA polymerase subunit RPC12/RpoP